MRLAGHAVQTRTFARKGEAVAWGHATEADLRARKAGVVRGTLQEVFDRYMTEVCPGRKAGDNEAKRLRAFAAMGLLPMQRQAVDVVAADIVRFRDARLGQVKPGTVLKELGILRAVFESARRDWGMMASNPVRDIKMPAAPPPRSRLFVGDECGRIVAALGFDGVQVTTLQHQVAVALLLAFETAMRAGEIVGLTWDRVHIEARFVRLDATKNGDVRDVPLSTRAVKLLGLMRGVDTVRVFTVSNAVRDALFRRARARCGIADLHFHDARATAVTQLAKRLDIHDLARMIGHRDLNSLLIYYRRTASDIARSLD